MGKRALSHSQPYCFTMAKANLIPLLFPLIFFCNTLASSTSSLSHDFYAKTCPNAEKIIFNVVSQKLREKDNTAAGALRIFFHDCFVEGCDASVLIASTINHRAERDAEINLSLPGDGYDVFFRAKKALELECPGIVSCADVMAIATRDLVNMVGGPSWEVPMGRRDGLISDASRVEGNLPRANQTSTQLISLFTTKGFDLEDMVALSGGHTLGVSNCGAFVNRIFHFNDTHEIDPSMDRGYALGLRAACPSNRDPSTAVDLDYRSRLSFDNSYFKNLERRYGLLATDQELHDDPRTRGLVEMMAKDQNKFFHSFAAAMVKMGSLGVKTGNHGEVRRNCDASNGLPSFNRT